MSPSRRVRRNGVTSGAVAARFVGLLFLVTGQAERTRERERRRLGTGMTGSATLVRRAIMPLLRTSVATGAIACSRVMLRVARRATLHDRLIGIGAVALGALELAVHLMTERQPARHGRFARRDVERHAHVARLWCGGVALGARTFLRGRVMTATTAVGSRELQLSVVIPRPMALGALHRLVARVREGGGISWRRYRRRRRCGALR